MITTLEARSSGAGEEQPEFHLSRLTLHDYRNFGELQCEFPEAGVAIVGRNGSGKTNLLEAIYYLQVFRSFRGARDAELVRFGQDVFRVEGGLRERQAERRLAAAYERSGRRKKVEVDGREAVPLSAAIGSLGAVVFRPDDIEIVRGSPAGRRRFLDILLSLVVPGYLADLQRYRSVLAQRNEALRGAAPAEVLAAWTEGLIAPGSAIMAARAAWVSSRAGAFSSYHEVISGGQPAELGYRAALAPPRDGETRSGSAPWSLGAREEWAERFRAALAGVEERERRRGFTLAGPHRDDLDLRSPLADSRSRDVRTYGSSGQQRTAALALRLVEADTLRERVGREPVYLLDDVFAELDEGRSERLLTLLDQGRSGQVILTAPKQTDVTLRGGALARWRIRNGRLLT
ncbi:MAG: DNA replication/repair protein RecF [Gemmatimonadota bacterium]